ncbi:response regulator transcription factor [Caldicellulosiruptoraceae bacterium PP1]
MSYQILTDREREIVKLIAEGNTNKQIAFFLKISEHTVKTHIKNIMLKTKSENRSQITSYYYKNMNAE